MGLEIWPLKIVSGIVKFSEYKICACFVRFDHWFAKCPLTMIEFIILMACL